MARNHRVEGAPAFRAVDLAGLVARLEKGGFRVTQDTPLEGCERVYVDDPFGNRIEWIESGPAGS